MTGQLENSAIEHLKKEIRLQVIPCHLQNRFVVKDYETLDSVSYFLVFQRGMDTFRTKTQFVMVYKMTARSFVLA